MPVDYIHPEYDEMMPEWVRARDFISGEKAVKKKGSVYLSELQDQDENEYRAYKERTKFLNASARTHEGLHGMVFMKDPFFKMPQLIELLGMNINLCGDSLYAYARNVVSEVLAVGRGGTLIDWSESAKRPYFAYYDAECIRNWRYEVRNDSRLLSLIVLSEKDAVATSERNKVGDESTKDVADPYEPVESHRLRVLRLLPEGVVAEIWTLAEDVGDKKASRERWLLKEIRELKRNGKPLMEIPFVFHTPDLATHCVPKPPLVDLISLNLTHYRLSADHYHGLHFVALPTPWVAGFSPTAELRIGSSIAWVSEKSDAQAGYLEFSGQGLAAIREELDRIEHSMAVLGARMLETQKREAETAEAMSIRQSGEGAVLSSISGACGVSITEALKWAYWFAKPGIAERSSISDKELIYELNSDFSNIVMSGAELISFVSAWIQRGISFDTLFYNLKKGEIIPPDRTKEQELELIEAEAPGLGLDLGQETGS